MCSRAHHQASRLVTVLVAILAVATDRASLAAEGPVSFRRDVMAVLSKAGCNSGPCHGNQNGKAGFKLSLRGEDPDGDYAALTRELGGRRTNPFEPDESLVLLKATARLAHEGGLRFRPDTPEYTLLRAWIEAGTPDDPPDAPRLQRLEVSPTETTLIEPDGEVQIRVRAVFSDGSRRDVRRLAVFEPVHRHATVSPDGTVRRARFGEETILVRYLDQQVPVQVTFVPRRPGFKWSHPRENNYVDTEIFAKLRRLRMNPSSDCDDLVFLRRVSLDLLGVPPTGAEARRFAADPSPDKRARLVEELLHRPEFADFWALKWSDVLRNEEKVLDPKGTKLFHRWVRDSLAANKPLDQFARELVAGTGSTYTNPPANFYRALRDPTARSEAVAQLFLGTRLGCARCHNHPFDRWTQTDYYDWADVFAGVQYRIVENTRRDGLDTHEFVGEQIVFESGEGRVKNPRTGRPAQARLLGTDTPMTLAVLEPPAAPKGPPGSAPPASARLEKLAAWLTGPENGQFARAQVNRVWFHLMGRGLVEPIDDFRATNPASHPGLLDRLAMDFARHKFDLRWLLRFLMSSRTYQLSSAPTPDNAEDEVNYSHVLPRRLTAEQLLDAQHQALGLPAEFQGQPVGIRASQLPEGSPVRRNELRSGSPEKFLALFGKPARLLT
ncbi:MAG TPA: DUF1549 domain-containing protein, partial [Methylomirabilota bacterium]|nr:DUF1549 domain-containing protein [Methylomirabilota bacterium]